MRTVFLAALFFASSLFSQEAASPLQDPEIKTFRDLAFNAGLRDLFQGTGPFTFFAPSNEAFKNFNKLQILQQPTNHDALVDLLIYHVVPGKYMSSTFKTMDLKTINGKELHISIENGTIKVNGANVTRRDMVGPNGVVYVIDKVLEP